LDPKIQAPFERGGVGNINQQMWFFIHYEMPGDHFLLREGGQGIDARKIDQVDDCVPAANGALMPGYRHSGEIADSLSCPGEGVEQG
jgi:hypothetical protein